MTGEKSSQPIRHAVLLLVSFALVYVSVVLIEQAPGPTALHSGIGLIGLLGGSVGGLGLFSYGVELFSDITEKFAYV